MLPTTSDACLVSLWYCNLNIGSADSMTPTDEQEEYFESVKTLIESMHTKSGGKKVMIVAHSMGGNYAYLLLQRQDQAWKDKHIQSLVTIGTPWGGAAGTLQTLAAGEDDDSSVLAKPASRALHRSHPSFVFLLPTADAVRERPLMQLHDGRSFTAAQLPELLQVIGDSEGAVVLRQIEQARHTASAPGVEVHCLRGTGSNTVAGIRYAKEKDFPFDPETIRGPGDGTVNQESADLCLRWARSADEKSRFETATFERVKHVDLVKNSRVVKYITDLIQRS